TEWKELSSGKTGDQDGWGKDDLIRALSQCGHAEAIRALAEQIPSHGVGTRSTILYHVANVEKDLRGMALTRAFADAVEDLLAKSLDDREATSSSSSRKNKPVDDPRICDLAAEALAGRWSKPELFDITGPFQTRDRQRVEVKNVWLEKRGKEALP